MQIQKGLILSILSLFTLLFTSCDENESGVDIIQFEARFVTEIDNRNVEFNNLSTGAVESAWDFGDDTTSSLANPTKTYDADGTYTVTLTVTDSNGKTDVYQQDIQVELILIQNGDFENGSQGWIVGVDDNAPAPIVTENGNSFYEVFITNPNPSQPFLVNLSQKLPITQGLTYVLTFDAWSDVERTIIAGIGLSGGDFSNDTETVSINQTQQQYQITLSSADFGAPDARVLFDSNGDGGLVRIDNVSLSIQE